MSDEAVVERSDESAPVAPEVAPGHWQVGLADLIVWVLTAGVTIGVVRGAQVFRITTPWRQQRLIGAILEALAIPLVLPLVRPAVRWARGDRRSRGGGWAALAWPIAWRVAALALLLGFVAEESWLLRVDHDRLARLAVLWNMPRYHGFVLQLDLSLYPACALLLLIGLVAGMGTAPLGPPVARRSRLWWLGPPLAGVVGVLLMARTDSNASNLIEYLILLALEAVSNAMRHRVLDRPALSTRLIHAGIQAAVAGAVVLVTALWVAHDFRKVAAEGPRSASWRAMLPRLASLVATATAGAYLLGVTLPTLHEDLAAGFWIVLSAREVAAILAAFGVLSAGLAARTVAPPSIAAQPPSTRRRQALAALRPLALGLLALSIVPYSQAVPSGDVPSGLDRVLGGIGAAQTWVLAHMPLAGAVWPYLDPEWLLWGLALLWLAAQITLLVAAPSPTRPCPFDALRSSRPAAAWALWLAAALTAICIAAMPVFYLAGLAIFHYRLNFL
jgi:hypothetical protein